MAVSEEIMEYEQVWALLAITLILGWSAVIALQDRSRSRQRLRVRELLHRERLAAIDKGIPLHDLPADLLVEPDEQVAVARAQLAALGAGLVLLLGGLGLIAALALTPDTPEMGGMRDLAPMGLIPTMTGAGLLLYHMLVRRATR
jgi:hypothetical protein